jgi:hypothetical protein
MKNQFTHRIFTVLFLLLLTGMTLQAQTSDETLKKEKLEQEKKIKELELQLKKQQMEWEMQMKKQQMEQEKKTAEMERAYRAQARSSSGASSGSRERSFVYAVPEPGDEPSYFIHSYGQDSQTQLTLRNSFNGETLSSDGEFEVDESTRKIRLSANGKVRHGEIHIKVLYPNGKVFKDLNINSSAQITFSQSLTVKEEEKNKYVGTWKYEIKTKTAEGSYMLSIMTQ